MFSSLFFKKGTNLLVCHCLQKCFTVLGPDFTEAGFNEGVDATGAAAAGRY